MKRQPAPAGVCRWCDQPVLNPKGQPTRGTWHPECVTAYKLIAWPAETRIAVFKRDNGICAKCRKDCKRPDFDPQWFLDRNYDQSVITRNACRASGNRWQHDHIRPLVEANGDLSYWLLDNVQTLCSPCHVEKGKEDNARRREARRLALQPELI